MQSRGSTRQWLCPQSLAEAQNGITVKMKGKWPTVLVINSNSDVPCSALLLPAGSISRNTNLPSLTSINTLGKLLIAGENKCLCPAQDPTQNFLRRPEIFSFTPTCLWWFLHSTTGEFLKALLCYMGRWFKQHQGCATPELGNQTPFLRVYTASGPILGYLCVAILSWVLEKVNGMTLAWCKYLAGFFRRN